MIRTLTLAALALAAPTAAFASNDAATPLIVKAVGDKDSVTLDPAKSYLIVQTSSSSSMFSFPVTFVRRPEKGDVEDYLRRRAIALDKAHAKWAGKHAKWESDVAAWQKMSSADRAAARIEKTVEPVEPTNANLNFPAIDMENTVMIGPFNRFSKKGGRSTFVSEITPGRYAFYGPVNIAVGAGTCMCMGSVEFEIKPGQIVYAGMMSLSLLDARQKAKAAGSPMPKTELDLPDGVNTITWEVPKEGTITDPRLAAYKIVPAELHASGRIANYFGVQIDRLTAIPGILEYDRDTVVDPRAKASGRDAGKP